MTVRLRHALETGALSLPESGRISVLSPPEDADLSVLPQERIEVVTPFRPAHDRFAALGFDCRPESDRPCSMAIICLPRAKARAWLLVGEAARRSSGWVVIDGAKSDGIDSMLKALRRQVGVSEPVAKAHGKLFWFTPGPDTPLAGPPEQPERVEGFVTAPGVFSAAEVDPASHLLAAALPPAGLGRHVVDLGAGWGYLGASILALPGLERLDLVEADHLALDCARDNLRDARCAFHWADARRWSPDSRPDAVVMNPPFHSGRAAEPELGRAFIAAAARILAPSGQLWMVANRHLPYEAALAGAFQRVQEAGGDRRFKVIHASSPRRRR
ncbi:class I SAM-dependent methyltransferase [Pontibaca methylaminivorans]|uniref:16S rRNA m(2)G 1207 methyltransferase n=1 Tax=Pontibaca methylaminivorans TaxID=515897 RepID=A0A1R3X358_9RHOB|nr:methyltransferase [Pontibaca methylaminivorans]SIT84324.1 16S rRNA m(2)G 1207 methyltransferase [Pontibaca methylaminivorans]